MRTRIALTLVAAALVAGCSSATHTWTRTAAPPTPVAVLAVASAAPPASPAPAVTPKATPAPKWAAWRSDFCLGMSDVGSGMTSLDMSVATSDAMIRYLANDAVTKANAGLAHLGNLSSDKWKSGDATATRALAAATALVAAGNQWDYATWHPSAASAQAAMDASTTALDAIGYTMDLADKLTASYHFDCRGVQ